MKHNLKNIPKLGNYPDEGTSKKEFVAYTEAVVEWLEGFENEIKEELVYVQSMKNLCALKHKKMFEWEEEHYEEILGEESK